MVFVPELLAPALFGGLMALPSLVAKCFVRRAMTGPKEALYYRIPSQGGVFAVYERQ